MVGIWLVPIIGAGAALYFSREPTGPGPSAAWGTAEGAATTVSLGALLFARDEVSHGLTWGHGADPGRGDSGPCGDGGFGDGGGSCDRGV